MQKYFTFHRKTPDNSETKPEKVILERWRWIAVYKDGTQLHQFDEETGLFHQFSEINQPEVVEFLMTNSLQTIRILVDPSMKIIHFYRNAVLHDEAGNEYRHRFYYFGYEKKVGFKNVKTLMAIDPEDHVTLSDVDFSLNPTVEVPAEVPVEGN